MAIDLFSNIPDAQEVPVEAKVEEPVLRQDEEILEADASFDFDGFQVVRREFFAHVQEPSVTFNGFKFYVNAACLNKFPKTEFVQVLVNPEAKILILRPCAEYAKDAFAWSTLSKGKRKPRQTTCKIFYAKIMALMGWAPDYRYKMLGRIIRANDEYLMAFDLTSPETYVRKQDETAKSKSARTPQFPMEWQDQFGLPVSQHSQSMAINFFDGYAVYSIKDPTVKKSLTAPVLAPSTEPPRMEAPV